VPRSPAALRPTELARAARVSPDTLRHYEAKGLLPAPARSRNGYREYPPEALGRVRLVRRAVALGFTLDELARIVRVRDQGGAPCRDVRDLAVAKLALLERRIADLRATCDRLRSVVEHWNDLLARTPSGRRAALLEALEGLVEDGHPSPLLPDALRQPPGAGGAAARKHGSRGGRTRIPPE
jgi:DNA-binding transcriptional MerR regulator